VKLSEWSNVAEIVSAVAIIGSLIYVAVQIDQNTVAVEASTQQGRLDFGRDQSELLFTVPGLAKLVMKAEKGSENLTEEERYLFNEYTSWRMSTWELVYQSKLDGIVSEESWIAWDAYFRLLIAGKPGYIKFFEETRPQWDTRFMNHVDEIIASHRRRE